MEIGGYEKFLSKGEAMKKRLLNFLVLLVILFCIVLPLGVVNVHAGNCQGMGCHGLNPHSTGCDYGATTYLSKSVTEVEVAIRKSLACNAKWTRIVNQKVTSQYVGGSAHFLMNGYQPHFSERSAGPIAQNYRIYTNMVGDASRHVISCGGGDPNSPISLPVSNSIYCVGPVP